MRKRGFEKLVKEVLGELPKEFQEKLDNVSVVVEDWPKSWQLFHLGMKPFETALVKKGGILFGLYEGVPKTKRGSGYAGVLPDKITIFQKPIEFFYGSPERIKEQVRKTVLHELAHHFGMDESKVRQILRKGRGKN